MKNWQTTVKILTLMWLLALQSVFANIPVTYYNLMGEEQWQMKGNHLRCGLSLPLPNYGIAYFEKNATHPAHFIVRQWDENHHISKAVVTVTPPVWKPRGPSFHITDTRVNPSRYSVYLNENNTRKLLIYLSQGYQVLIQYRSEQNFKISLVLSPIKFRKMYARYQRCLGELLPFNYKDVACTTFNYPTDGHELSDEMKDRLRKIAQYVRADRDIEKIRVVGYTDDSGRNGYNNAISQDRAETVEKYLTKLGISKHRLLVTWVGELKPIGRNDTDAGRAMNRRVEIRLIKK